ncbi:MAG: hypothetical protein Q9223_003862 [Gallowayella weberi]
MTVATSEKSKSSGTAPKARRNALIPEHSATLRNSPTNKMNQTGAAHKGAHSEASSSARPNHRDPPPVKPIAPPRPPRPDEKSSKSKILSQEGIQSPTKQASSSSRPNHRDPPPVKPIAPPRPPRPDESSSNSKSAPPHAQ